MKKKKSDPLSDTTDDEEEEFSRELDSHAGSTRNRGFVTASSNSITLSSGSTFDGSAEEGEMFDNDRHDNAGFASLLAAALHRPSTDAAFPPPMDDVVVRNQFDGGTSSIPPVPNPVHVPPLLKAPEAKKLNSKAVPACMSKGKNKHVKCRDAYHMTPRSSEEIMPLRR